MKRLRSILALGAFFVLPLVLSACGGGVPGNSVAVVAGNPVTTGAFNHWMYVAAKGNAAQSPGAPVIVPTDPPNFAGCIAQVRKQIPSLAKTTDKQLRSECGALFTSLSSQVMDFLIKGYWYQADAARTHISLTDAQVQRIFTTEKQAQFPTDVSFQAFLAQSGQTVQDLLFRVRVNEIYKRLLARHMAAVTPAQIQAYYSSHVSQFGTPEARSIRVVRTNSLKQAQAAKAALAGGQSWNAVAKQYSVDVATKSHGGLLPGVTKGQQEAALDSATFSAHVNKLIGPIHGTFGYYILEVIKITPATQKTLAQATPLVRQTLAAQSQSAAQAAVDASAKKNWLHQTICRSGFTVADCSGYKAPKTSSTPATPTTTTG